jgi:hypothetical protein
MNDDQLHELPNQALETESGGVQGLAAAQAKQVRSDMT